MGPPTEPRGSHLGAKMCYCQLWGSKSARKQYKMRTFQGKTLNLEEIRTFLGVWDPLGVQSVLGSQCSIRYELIILSGVCMPNLRVLGLKMGSLMKIGPLLVNGTPYWGMGSRLGSKCVPVNCGDLKLHENQIKLELYWNNTKFG